MADKCKFCLFEHDTDVDGLDVVEVHGHTVEAACDDHAVSTTKLIDGLHALLAAVRAYLDWEPDQLDPVAGVEYEELLQNLRDVAAEVTA